MTRHGLFLIPLPLACQPRNMDTLYRSLFTITQGFSAKFYFLHTLVLYHGCNSRSQFLYLVVYDLWLMFLSIRSLAYRRRKRVQWSKLPCWVIMFQFYPRVSTLVRHISLVWRISVYSFRRIPHFGRKASSLAFQRLDGHVQYVPKCGEIECR